MTMASLVGFIRERPYTALVFAGLVGMALNLGFAVQVEKSRAASDTVTYYLFLLPSFLFSFSLPVAIASAAAAWRRTAASALRIGLWGAAIAAVEFRLEGLLGALVKSMTQRTPLPEAFSILARWAEPRLMLVLVLMTLPIAAMAAVGYYMGRLESQMLTRNRLFWVSSTVFLIAVIPLEVSDWIAFGPPDLGFLFRVVSAALVGVGVMAFIRCAASSYKESVSTEVAMKDSSALKTASRRSKVIVGVTVAALVLLATLAGWSLLRGNISKSVPNVVAMLGRTSEQNKQALGGAKVGVELQPVPERTNMYFPSAVKSEEYSLGGLNRFKKRPWLVEARRLGRAAAQTKGLPYNERLADTDATLELFYDESGVCVGVDLSLSGIAVGELAGGVPSGMELAQLVGCPRDVEAENPPKWARGGKNPVFYGAFDQGQAKRTVNITNWEWGASSGDEGDYHFIVGDVEWVNLFAEIPPSGSNLSDDERAMLASVTAWYVAQGELDFGGFKARIYDPQDILGVAMMTAASSRAAKDEVTWSWVGDEIVVTAPSRPSEITLSVSPTRAGVVLLKDAAGSGAFVMKKVFSLWRIDVAETQKGGTFLASTVRGTSAASIKARPDMTDTALSTKALLNMKYNFEKGSRVSRVRVKNGKWCGGEGGVWGEGNYDNLGVEDTKQRGDLNGDGIEEAVVLVNTATAASGYVVSIAVVAERDGSPSEIASVNLGDRVVIGDVSISDGRITVRGRVHGEGDWPTVPAASVFKLQGKKLVVVSGDDYSVWQ